MHRLFLCFLASFLSFKSFAATNISRNTPSQAALLLEASGRLMREAFHREKADPNFPHKTFWSTRMGIALRTLRFMGNKYGDDVLAMNRLTGMGFPKGIAHMAAGRKSHSIQIVEDETGEWYLSKEKKEKPNSIILYIHGGAMCLCSPKTHRELLLRLAAITERRIFATHYRKPPAHPHPAPLDDCYSAYERLHGEGYQIHIVGDSAGGTLAMQLTQRLLKENSLPLPKSLSLISPWVDLEEWASNTNKKSSIQKHSQVDFLPLASLEVFAKAYLGEASATNLHDLSPVNFDLEGFPPVQVLRGEYEMLADQQARLVASFKKQGQFVEERVAPGMVHVYPIFASLRVDAAKRSFGLIREFLNSLPKGREEVLQNEK